MSEAGVALPPEPLVGPRTAEPSSGRKLVAGFRPVQLVGIEVQYLELGEGEARLSGGWQFAYAQLPTAYEQTNLLQAKTDASVLSAILFLPVTDARFDVYGKIGIAKLDESIATTVVRYDCGFPLPSCQNVSYTDARQSDTVPYLGIGARLRVARAAAVRLEYEGIERDAGDRTTMLSLGVAWEF
jgi:hypothetical protein